MVRFRSSGACYEVLDLLVGGRECIEYGDSELNLCIFTLKRLLDPLKFFEDLCHEG